MDREVVYKLRIVPDPQGAATLREFGRMLGGAKPSGGGGGGSAFGSMLRDVGKLSDVMAKSGKASLDSLDKQMRKLDEVHSKRLAQERNASDRAMREFDKQVAAFDKAERRKTEIAEREAQRQHNRHRARQRSIAIQGRERRAAFDSLQDTPAFVGGGPVVRPAGMGRQPGGGGGVGFSGRRFGGQAKDAMGALVDMGHGVALSGLMGKRGDQLLGGLLGVESGFHFARGLTKAGPLGAGIAAAAGGGAGIHSAFTTARDIGEFGFRGGSRPGSFNDRVGGGMAFGLAKAVNFAGGTGSSLGSGFSGNAVGNLANSMKALEKAEKDLADTRTHKATMAAHKLNALEAKMARDAVGAEASRITEGALQSATRGFTPMGANRRAQARAQEELSDATRENRSLRGIGDSPEANQLRAASAERVIAAQRNLVDLLQQEQDLQHKITDDILQRRDAMMAMRDEAQGRLKDAKMAFGNLSPGDQQRAIGLKRKLDEAERFDQGSRTGRSFMGDKIRNSMTADDRQFLAGIGTSEVQRQTTKGALASADKGRFDMFFGKEERQTVMVAEQAARNLQKLAITIQPKMNVEVKVEGDVKVVTDAITAAVIRETDKWRSMVLMEVDRKLKERTVATSRGQR